MDLRIEKTYRALLSAFSNLLEDRRYENITVAMLCDAAMIRRTTFYKHFEDKADFCGFFMDSLRNELLQNVSSEADAEQGVAILHALVEFMQGHEKLVDHIFGSSMSGMMVLMMEDKVAETIRNRYEKLFSDDQDDQERLSVSAEFAAGGVVRVLSSWWSRGHKSSDEDRAVEFASDMIARVFEC